MRILDNEKSKNENIIFLHLSIAELNQLIAHANKKLEKKIVKMKNLDLNIKKDKNFLEECNKCINQKIY